MPKRPGKTGSNPPVHVFAVARSRDQDDQFAVFDTIKYSVIADPDTIDILGSRKALCPPRTGGSGQRVNAWCEAFSDGTGQVQELAPRLARKGDPVGQFENL